MKKNNIHTRKVIAALALVAGAAGVGTGAAYAATPSTDAPTVTLAPEDLDPALDDACTCEELPEGAAESDASEAAVAIAGPDGAVESLDDLDPAEKAEVLEQLEADNAAFIAELDAKGVDYELVSDPLTGVEFPSITDTDDAALASLDGIVGSPTGSSVVIGTVAGDESATGFSFDGGDFSGPVEDQEFSDALDSLDPEARAELLDNMKTDNDAFIAALEAKGIDFELIADPATGLELPAITGDDAAVQEALDEVVSAASAACEPSEDA